MRGGGFNPYFGGMMMMPMQPMYYRGGRGRAFRYVGGVWSHDHLVATRHGSTFVEEVCHHVKLSVDYFSLSLSFPRGRARTNWYAPY